MSLAAGILETAAGLQGPPITWGAEGIAAGFGEAEIKGYDNFGMFVKAVEMAGLSDVLKGPGPFTVFAPVDSAFGGKEALLQDPKALAEILKYHVVPQKIAAGSISADLVTVNGASLTYSRRFRKTFLDDAMMDPKYPKDIACDNGVFHAIDSIMVPGAYNKISAEAGLAGNR
jgi:uncharacterized surface protein with fasciclin (FAS1) repeats